MPALTVTAAVLPPFPHVFEVVGDPPVRGAPWSGLPKVEVPASADETLRDVLRRACDLAGVRVTAECIATLARLRLHDGLPRRSEHAADMLVYIGFRQPDDDDILVDDDPPIRRRDTRVRQTLVVIRDELGRAVWRRPGLEATLRELLDAAEIGLIDGNPLEPYLIPSVPQGDLGGLDAWINFKDALVIFWTIATAAAIADGALGMQERLAEVRRRRRPDLPKVVEHHAPAWSERGAAPSDLRRLLASRPRTSADIAALLGCSTSEGEALLWGLGFTYDEAAKVWRDRGDPIAELIADDIALSVHSSVTVLGHVELLREVSEQRLAHLLIHGEPPSLPESRRMLDTHQTAELEAESAHEIQRDTGSDESSLAS